MDLYVYYRVSPENASPLSAGLKKIQNALAGQHGVTTALKHRNENKNGYDTWMEIYFGVGQGFEATVEEAVAEAGLIELMQGPRHIERFFDVEDV